MEAYAHQARDGGPEEVAGLTRGAAGELAVVRGLAKVLDEAVTIPGTRRKIGLDAILGLIPGIGDLGSAAIGGYIILAASRLGVPAVVLWRMVLNQAIDTVFGFIPLVGDIFDVAWRSNAKNAALLTQSLTDPLAARRASWWSLLGVGFAFLAVTAAGVAGTVLLVRHLTT